MHRLLLTAAILLPTAVLAVEEDFSVPQPTPTTQGCAEGQIWDDKTTSCVDAESRLIDDGARYRAARAFAHAGRYDDALRALEAMADPGDDRVLTYKGFVHRKRGAHAAGMAYYRQALARNPDNLLARSYMGMGLVEAGEHDAARAELSEIRARGGRGTWPEVALRLALERGRPAY